MIGVYDYTVILTYLSMISGCIGTIIAMTGIGHPFVGALFLMVSGLCDGFDGRVARSKKNRTTLEKNFGVQIDAFSDLIAFGVLPAAIGVAMLRTSEKFTDRPFWKDNGRYEWYPILLVAVAVIYVLAGMIRLAYFNATEDERNKEAEAKAAGADYVGLDEYIDKIKGGWTDIDVIITMPAIMGKIGALGRVLGPRGLMPNPKSGTVTMDVAKAVKEVKQGKIDFKVDKFGIVHTSIGKVSFEAEKIAENANEFIQTIIKLKPTTAKGTYIKSIYLSSTMSQGIKIDPKSVE